METISPLGSYITVKPSPAQEEKNGFELAQTAQVKPNRGTVLSCGPGLIAKETGVRIPISVEVGDTILYSKYAGTPISIEGEPEPVLMMKEEEVLGIVKQN